jgi:hypothetical protein
VRLQRRLQVGLSLSMLLLLVLLPVSCGPMLRLVFLLLLPRTEAKLVFCRPAAAAVAADGKWWHGLLLKGLLWRRRLRSSSSSSAGERKVWKVSFGGRGGEIWKVCHLSRTPRLLLQRRHHRPGCGSCPPVVLWLCGVRRRRVHRRRPFREQLFALLHHRRQRGGTVAQNKRCLGEIPQLHRPRRLLRRAFPGWLPHLRKWRCALKPRLVRGGL